MSLATASCYLCPSLNKVYENPTTGVTILYQDRRSQTLFYHNIAEESPTDYMGVEGLGTRKQGSIKEPGARENSS